VQIKTILDLLGNEISRQFIGEHLKDDVKKLALDAGKYINMDIKAIAGLISLYQKAEIKLPEHYKKLAALTPKSYEQSTSEAVAKFKASLLKLEEKHVVNITGGLGIDDWAMSEYASKIDSCEIDSEIHQLAEFNLHLFRKTNIVRHFVDGIDYLKSIDSTDIIYADPDRRPDAAKVFRLEDSEPNILNNISDLLNKAKQVWIKISPMADLTYLINALPDVKQIYVIAHLGEVKELLVCCEKTNISSKTPAIPQVDAVNIGNHTADIFAGRNPQGQPSYSNSGNFLYEPNKAIIKAGLSKDYCEFINANMLAANSHLFVSDHKIENVFGRTFIIKERIAYKPKLIKAFFNTNSIKKANVTIRNFRETTAQLRERFKLNDGGEDYLFFTTDQDQNAWMFHCCYS
jgi:hypothetical protein